MIKVVGIFVGLLVAAKVATLAYVAGLWLVSPALTAMKVALGIAKVAMIAFNVIANLNPFGAMVTAVGLLSAGLFLLSQNWEKVTTAFKYFKDLILNFSFDKLLSGLGAISKFIGLDKIFGSSPDITSTQNIIPVQAQAQLQQQNINNNQANITVNVAEGKVKSVDTTGNFKSNVFLNPGIQQ